MVLKKVKKWTDGDSGSFTDGTRFRLAIWWQKGYKNSIWND